ncbi:MFS transporter [Arthrobacter sp. UYEF20]|uniref:MFS transporter n=1 Tax=Arthrobacter sp. UYEF20 TaxID=1756363 RepID=UPI0033983C92
MSNNSVEPEGSGRVPLTARRAVSVFGISVVGFMTANLVPVMIVALTGELGFSVTDAGVLITASLLACAASCLLTSRWSSAGGGRYVVARVGLALTALGFGAAAFVPSVPVVIAGIVIGGMGAGGAVSAGGAALGALRNPDRASGINGFTNRAIVSVVLFAIPALGAGMGSAFGLLAGLAAAALLTTAWLPDRPAPTSTSGSSSPATTIRSSRTTTFAGVGLLACFALWALSEDSLWAVAATMGADQASLDETGMGLALSLSALGGLVATALVGVFGRRLGRTIPLAVALVAGGLLKLLAGTVTDPGWYLMVIIAWNTLYAAAFVYVLAVAVALDASGRWSAPLLGVYLIGSSFAPVFGTSLSAAIGYAGMGMVLAGMTFALLVPFLVISRTSVRAETTPAGRSAPEPEFPQAAIV